MRFVPVPVDPRSCDIVADLVHGMGQADFSARLLRRMREVLNTASFSVYRAGPKPALFFSGSLGVPDRTLDCWRAYLSGPCRQDQTLNPAPLAQMPAVCHISARDMAPAHRTSVYEAHGVAERVSVLQRDGKDHSFALNFYRHACHRPYTDSEIEGFAALAPTLLALVRRHVELGAPRPRAGGTREALAQRCPDLTSRELDVCERLVGGMTQDGIAADLGVGVTSVRTYRARAYARLGIHFRSELTAMLMRH